MSVVGGQRQIFSSTDHVSVEAGNDPVTPHVTLILSPGTPELGAELREGPLGIATIIILILAGVL